MVSTERSALIYWPKSVALFCLPWNNRLRRFCLWCSHWKLAKNRPNLSYFAKKFTARSSICRRLGWPLKNDYLIEQVVLSKSLIKINLNWNPAAADLRMLDSFFLFILFRSNSSGRLAKIFESFVLRYFEHLRKDKGQLYFRKNWDLDPANYIELYLLPGQTCMMWPVVRIVESG